MSILSVPFELVKSKLVVLNESLKIKKFSQIFVLKLMEKDFFTLDLESQWLSFFFSKTGHRTFEKGSASDFLGST